MPDSVSEDFVLRLFGGIIALGGALGGGAFWFLQNRIVTSEDRAREMVREAEGKARDASEDLEKRLSVRSDTMHAENLAAINRMAGRIDVLSDTGVRREDLDAINRSQAEIKANMETTRNRVHDLSGKTHEMMTGLSNEVHEMMGKIDALREKK